MISEEYRSQINDRNEEQQTDVHYVFVLVSLFN